MDQNPRRKPGFECVQGALNLLPRDREGGGTALAPGSHRTFSTERFENALGPGALRNERDYVRGRRGNPDDPLAWRRREFGRRSRGGAANPDVVAAVAPQIRTS